MDPGYGFDQDAREYFLKLDDIPQLANKPPGTPTFNITLSFKQRGIVRKTMDTHVVDLPLKTSLYPSSIMMVFKLPSIGSILSKFAYFINVLIKRKRDLYEIAPEDQSALDPDLEKIDKRNGKVIFDAAGEIRGPIQFAYKFVGRVDVPSLIIGVIFTIISGVIVELIIEAIHTYLLKGSLLAKLQILHLLKE